MGISKLKDSYSSALGVLLSTIRVHKCWDTVTAHLINKTATGGWQPRWLRSNKQAGSIYAMDTLDRGIAHILDRVEIPSRYSDRQATHNLRVVST